MNRRLEEELLQTAFGEASPEEMAALERRVMSDPEASKAFRTYQSMKEGLKNLGDIPEHQLSTERLRHAILEQGLKPKRESNPLFGWLAFAPAAAAAVVVGFMLMNQQQQGPAPIYVGNSDLQVKTDSDAAPVEINRNLPKPNETVAATTVVPAPEESRPTSIVRTAKRGIVYRAPGTRGGTRRSDPELVVSVSPVAYGPPAPVAAEVNEDSLIVRNPRDRDKENDLIVIQPERDSATGANKATEVGSASNVAIGG